MAVPFIDPNDIIPMPHGGNMSPVARQYLSGLSPEDAPSLPGCTVNKTQDKPVFMSNEMFQAYVMMRGPGNGFGTDPDDPLLDWILLRKDVPNQAGKKLDHGHKDIKRMISNLNKVLRSEPSSEESPQASVFEFQRPRVDHIQPPPDMDLSMHMLNACCADFEFEDDENGDEQHVPRGRISPCTFLAWSKGCRSWKDGHPKTLDQDLRVNSSRRRPESPMLGDTPPSALRPNRWPRWTQNQECVESGIPLSPHYYVSSNPSMLWDAEGIDGDRMDWKPHFEDYYSRMDHVAAKKLRRLKQFGKPGSETLSPASKNEDYAYSEIDEIIADDIKDLSPKVDTQGVQNHIGNQYAIIAAADAESKQLDLTLREQTDRIRELEFERETIQLAVWNLKNKRAEEQAAKSKMMGQQPENQKRRGRILSHFRAHLKDVDYKYSRSLSKLEQERSKKIHNDSMIQNLENDISKACEEVGKSNPQEVFQELVEGETKYRVRDPKAEACHDARLESAYTDVQARPSPLNFVKGANKPAPEKPQTQIIGTQLEQSEVCAPKPQYPVQYPFFYPQFGFDPYAAYGIYGYDFEQMQAGTLPTSDMVPRAQENSREDKGNGRRQQLESEVDVYDAQGFPISPKNLAVKPVAGWAPGCTNSLGKVNGNPLTSHPWAAHPQPQTNVGAINGSFDFRSNFMPANGMDQTLLRDQSHLISETKQRGFLELSPTQRDRSPFKPSKEAYWGGQ